ncbi:MAG: 1,2-phenylacetyl-CoA epoxidase subunit PaaD [Bacteroidota bacterium]
MIKTLLRIPQGEISEALAEVSDPEIPVLTILDLGVVRKVEVNGKHVRVELTPTYTGCPAMDTIGADICSALEARGFVPEINLVLSPAWSTDWISAEGRVKLVAYGIAPPLGEDLDKRALFEGAKVIPCPQCGSTHTKMVSQFGSTACKALFRCEDCLEPFDYFKCLT